MKHFSPYSDKQSDEQMIKAWTTISVALVILTFVSFMLIGWFLMKNLMTCYNYAGYTPEITEIDTE